MIIRSEMHGELCPEKYSQSMNNKMLYSHRRTIGIASVCSIPTLDDSLLLQIIQLDYIN